MKKILFLLCITLSGFASSQKIDQEIIKDNDATKVNNYTNALSWAAQNSKELRIKNILVSDSNLGVVSLNINATLGSGIGVYYNTEFNLKIEVKDNKYKISYLSPIIMISMKNDDYSQTTMRGLKLIRERLKLIESLSMDKFDSKLEWNYKDVILAKDDIALDETKKKFLNDILDRMMELQTNLNDSIFEAMLKNNEW
ncbi:hypothetical protein [Chryseobacterium sp. ERMR1:04]|uniref:hypothetical protein n=1 Tax=Chryseobacterium sp. ERMR1:04 TaxID=1705393 RepID=UPI0006C843CA|nr:hypothetical protein [Chryseobacterium sp. ERMR1:04]KPH14250.1 hypothetical protein AMQ68_01655 [Chryseobacterium sp. ERMR1:04]